MLALVALLAGAAGAVEFDARVQWYSTLQWLPEDDLQRQLGDDASPDDHGADLRLMWRENAGALRFSLDHSTTWLYGDSTRFAAAPGLTFDQTPTGDAARAVRLSWDINESNKARAWHRIDRLAMEYRRDTLAVTVGRQAITWGGGLTFAPFDLFNPFAPTTVARDYKPGDDLVLVEKLFGDGGELQMLGIARRAAHGDVSFGASSLAAKYRRPVGDSELELMTARHREQTVLGLGVRIPLGGALLRSDVTATRLPDEQWRASGLVNVDYGFALFERTAYVFAEYYHNGFGLERVARARGHLPARLARRVADGEVFNIGRDYLALGGQIQWHAILNHGISWIGNLNDGSGVLTMNLTVDAGNRATLQAGFIHPFGDTGEEYGGVAVNAPPSPGQDVSNGAAQPTTTTGGGGRGYLRIVYYF